MIEQSWTFGKLVQIDATTLSDDSSSSFSCHYSTSKSMKLSLLNFTGDINITLLIQDDNNNNKQKHHQTRKNDAASFLSRDDVVAKKEELSSLTTPTTTKTTTTSILRSSSNSSTSPKVSFHESVDEEEEERKKKTIITPTKEELLLSPTEQPGEDAAILVSPSPNKSCVPNVESWDGDEEEEEEELDDDQPTTTTNDSTTGTTTSTTPPRQRGRRKKRRTTTKLHELCGRQSLHVTLHDLQQCLLNDPEAVRTLDEEGRYPLHILGSNTYLATMKEDVVKVFAIQLCHLYPNAILTPDGSSNLLPFVEPLALWVKDVYSRRQRDGYNTIGTVLDGWIKKGPDGTLRFGSGMSKVSRHLRSWSTDDSDNRGQNNNNYVAGRASSSMADHDNDDDVDQGIEQVLSYDDDESDNDSDSENNNNDGTTTSMIQTAFEATPSFHKRSSRRFPKAQISGSALFAIKMLSKILDFLASGEGYRTTFMKTGSNSNLNNDTPSNQNNTNNTTEQQQDQQQQQFGSFQQRKEMVLMIVQSIPNLMKTILLVEENDVRHELLQSSFIKRVLYCPESIRSYPTTTKTNGWILEMLKKTGIPSKRAVDYFEALSNVTFEDFCGNNHHNNNMNNNSSSDKELYYNERSKILDALEEQSADIIPSLFVLPEYEIERAAATSIIWNVLNRGLSRPFVIGIVLVDFVLHITLMISFRSSVENIEFKQASLGTQIPSAVVSSITTFFLLRKIGEALALLNISQTVFKSYLMDLWNLFDLLSIILTIAANSYSEGNPDDYRPRFNSFVLALLWLKVLSFLKAINMQMATFVLSLVQILKDIRFFAIVLAVIIMMFGDLMHIMYTTSNDGELCTNDDDDEEMSGTVADFCHQSYFRSYLRMYAILIGDFEYDDYRQTTSTEVVFIGFTLVGVIILLNVLIAVVSDSYEKSTLQAKYLFGRARVGFLAEHLALEQFLQPGTNPMEVFSTTTTSSSSSQQDRMTLSRKLLSLVMRLGRWMFLLIMIYCAMFAEVYLFGRAVDVTRQPGDTSIFIIIMLCSMAFFLTIALWIVFDFIFHELVKKYYVTTSSSCCFLSKFFICNSSMVQWSIRIIQNYVFGGNMMEESDNNNQGLVDDEWSGKLNYLEQKMKIIISESETNILSKMEKLLQQHQ